jgi:hypothetical protein
MEKQNTRYLRFTVPRARLLKAPGPILKPDRMIEAWTAVQSFGPRISDNPLLLEPLSPQIFQVTAAKKNRAFYQIYADTRREIWPFLFDTFWSANSETSRARRLPPWTPFCFSYFTYHDCTLRTNSISIIPNVLSTYAGDLCPGWLQLKNGCGPTMCNQRFLTGSEEIIKDFSNRQARPKQT